MYSSELCIMFWHGGNSLLTNGASVYLGFKHLIYKWMTAVQAICKPRVRIMHSSEASKPSLPERGRLLINEGYLQ